VTARLKWPPIIQRAAEIAGGSTMTLRQCFYILFSEGAIPNTDTSYKQLSSLTAEARRDGWFPSFIDGTREIFQYLTFDGLEDAVGRVGRSYRRDRTEGQPWQIWIAGEKRTLASQLREWFGDLGVPIVVCAGYASQTLCDDVRAEVDADGRPSVVIYAGDFDPSGEDIARDFLQRVGVFREARRVAVTAEQITKLSLPSMPGKAKDSRAAGFVARHGTLAQVEVEALRPETLRALYQDAVDEFQDVSVFDDVLEQEREEREQILQLVEEGL